MPRLLNFALLSNLLVLAISLCPSDVKTEPLKTEPDKDGLGYQSLMKP